MTSWENGELHVTLAVPYGCSACVRLPYHPDDAQPEVGAGTYEWQYVPTVDLLARYDEGTLFKDMLDDPEAMAAIREELGLLAFYLDIGAEDYLYETLSTISHMEYLGFRPEKVGKLRKRLLALRIS